MNLQRREEIRELIAEITRYEELGATLDLESKARDAITELLAHIDTLEQTAAERVIARGAAVKPHTFGEIVNQVRDIASQYAGTEQLRERIAYALAPHFERDAGPAPDYTGEGSAWVPAVEARAVVVPENIAVVPHDGLLLIGSSKARQERHNVVGAYFDRLGNLQEIREGSLYDRQLQSLPRLARAIPADRVLGEGMVAVPREELHQLRGLESCARAVMAYDGLLGTEERNRLKRLDALRANQGGAAT